MEGFVKIDFEITKDGITYRDALYLPEGYTQTPEEIEAMQMERFNNWVTFVQDVATFVPPNEPIQ